MRDLSCKFGGRSGVFGAICLSLGLLCGFTLDHTASAGCDDPLPESAAETPESDTAADEFDAQAEIAAVPGPEGSAVELPAEPAATLAGYFGFMPVEVYKVHDRAHSMVVGDFNDDGLFDMAVADDAHSRIALLIQRADPSDSPPTVSEQVNMISSDWRFRMERIPVERQLLGLAAADFNQDGRDDLAWLGAPDRLTVRRQTTEGGWETLSEYRLPDLKVSGGGLLTGDLNGDGLTDLVALGEKGIYLLLQSPQGGLGEPDFMPHSSTTVRGFGVADLNGDGRDDLYHLAEQSGVIHVRVRFQEKTGELGPVHSIPARNTRVAVAADLSGDTQAELLVIDSQTERLRVLRWDAMAEALQPLSSPLVYGYGRTGNTEGDLVLGDLDGDGFTEIVVSDPDGANLTIFPGSPGGLQQGIAFPSLEGITHLRMLDIDGDRRKELLVLSPKERILGLCRYEQERLSFPLPIRLGWEPVAFDLADVSGDGRTEVLVLAQAAGDRRASTLLIGRLNETGQWELLGEPATVNLKGDPHRMLHGDFDGDGRQELVVTYKGGRGPQVFGFGDGLEVRELGTSGVPDVGFSELFIEHHDTGLSSLVTSQGRFARRLVLEEDGHWRIIEQFNAEGGNPKIAGAVVLDLDPAPGLEMVLWDDNADALRLFRMEEGVARQYDQIEVGDFSLLTMLVRDINQDGREDLIMVGTTQFAILLNGVSLGTFEEVATYESSLTETVFYSDIVVGDVNGDGRPEPLLIDTTRRAIEVVASRPEWRLDWGTTFTVFEAKSYSGGLGGGRQPRQALIADVTGDGADDLILLVHDRILVYPQDTGEME